MQEELRFRFITDRFKKSAPPERVSEEEKDAVLQIPLNEIMPNPYQPRSYFNVSDLEELAASIKQVGVITPISVRRAPGGYEIVCGERRVRAARLAGLEKIPAIMTKLSDRESAVVAITENLQRRDLSFFEEAESMKSLIECHSLTQEQVAERLGKSQAAVANKLRLLKLQDSVKAVINEGGLCERHARALLRLPTEELRLAASRRAVELKLNVTATERMVQQMLEEEPRRRILRRDVSSFEKERRLFRNTVEKTVQMLKDGGMKPSVTEREGEEFLEYVIRIEKQGSL